MNFATFKETLNNNPDMEIELKFATGNSVAPHFHVTEVGKVTKDFVDCGGTRRLTETCVLQTLVANDVDHRLLSTKLAGVLAKTESLGLQDDYPVEAEVQTDTIGLYSVGNGRVENGKLVFELKPKTTACLAPDVCEIDGTQTPTEFVSISQNPLAPSKADSDCCGGGGSAGGG